jgi:hypothetical protein
VITQICTGGSSRVGSKPFRADKVARNPRFYALLAKKKPENSVMAYVEYETVFHVARAEFVIVQPSRRDYLIIFSGPKRASPSAATVPTHPDI